jgi:diguanylate cyclase (GGDEF)-like protein
MRARLRSSLGCGAPLAWPDALMPTETSAYSLPRWRVTRWLVYPGPDVPDEIRAALVGSLYGTLPIFAGGVVNTIAVALLCALRMQDTLFSLWFCLECAICLARLAVLIVARRAAAAGRATPTDLYLILAPFWALSVGYGAFISLISGDWVVATLSCLSAAAMVGGICFRNFGAPRMAAVMIVLSLGPTCPGAALSGNPILLIVLLQIPFYLVSMTIAAYRLNKLLVTTMRSERDHDHRAQHDALTGLSNRAGLSRAVEAKWAGPTGRRPLALLYLDLDGFKSVNDTYGHAAGDRLLGMVAERLKLAIRAGDCAARVGGDEFVLLCDNVDREGVRLFGERLIREIADWPYGLAENDAVKIGVSIGVAMSPDHGTDLPTLLGAADQALYAAKAMGRSQLAIARIATGPAANESEPLPEQAVAC